MGEVGSIKHCEKRLPLKCHSFRNLVHLLRYTKFFSFNSFCVFYFNLLYIICQSLHCTESHSLLYSAVFVRLMLFSSVVQFSRESYKRYASPCFQLVDIKSVFVYSLSVPLYCDPLLSHDHDGPLYIFSLFYGCALS